MKHQLMATGYEQTLAMTRKVPESELCYKIAPKIIILPEIQQLCSLQN